MTTWTRFPLSSLPSSATEELTRMCYVREAVYALGRGTSCGFATRPSDRTMCHGVVAPRCYCNPRLGIHRRNYGQSLHVACPTLQDIYTPAASETAVESSIASPHAVSLLSMFRAPRRNSQVRATHQSVDSTIRMH